MSTFNEPDDHVYLFQALWLSFHVYVPLDDIAGMVQHLINKLTPEHALSPFAASAATIWTLTKGENHPQQKKILSVCYSMLNKCASAREVPEEGFKDWLDREGLRDRKNVFSVLLSNLEEGVGEENWLFDRSVFK